MSMKYEVLSPITREKALLELASENWERVSQALLRLALHDSDPRWLEEQILAYLQHDHAWVRGTAALALGHVARLHGALDVKRVVPALGELLVDSNRDTRAKAQDALDDIEMFIQR